MTPEGFNTKENGREENYEGTCETRHTETCSRCGGLMIYDYCIDMQDDTGTLRVVVKRCTQCGDLIDPLILKNRLQPIESIKIRGPHRRIMPMTVSIKKDREK